MTRVAFGQEFCGREGSPPGSKTVQGWEEEGKKPEDPHVVNALARAGIATHADWFRPALCPRCEQRSDSREALTCAAASCPLAHFRAEAA